MKYSIVFSVVIASFLALEGYADTKPYWIFFADHGGIDVGGVIAAKRSSPAEPINRSRRAKLFEGGLFDESDVPVNPGYIAAVAGYAARLRTVSRYFNAVSAELDEHGVGAVKQLPFVRGVEPVMGFRRQPEPFTPVPEPRMKRESIDYGNAYDQISMIGIDQLHGLGYLGAGIRIAVLDSGFDGLEHAAFDSITISDRRDFIDGDGDVGGDDHGTEVLSIMAALDQGRMIGASPYATYILARTEDRQKEVRVEEDYWIAGVEWADSLGADVINSSLGYNEFEDFKYTYGDMDGKTALTTIAANMAVERGITVVASAGNHGNEPWYYISSPADGFNVIAVGSVDRSSIVSAFSSRGPTADGRIKPDCMALGEQVWMVDVPGKNTYHYANGTSFSAPAVSGAVALLLEINPRWTPTTVVNSLRTTARAAGPDSLYGYGIADVFAASGLKGSGPAVSSFTVFDPFPQPLVVSYVNHRLYFPMDVPVGGGIMSIAIYTFTGEKIWSTERTVEKTGSFRDRTEAPVWDGTNYEGGEVASGVYFYTIRLTGYSGYKGKIAVIR